MKIIRTESAKIVPPAVRGTVLRPRLFRLLDRCGRAVTWISAPAGSGKTTLVRSWLASRGLPCLWYQLDEGDGDPATFFYYLGLAAKRAAPQYKRSLPLLTPEFLANAPLFGRRYFESLCSRLGAPFVLVFDNYHDVGAGSAFHEIFREGLSVLPQGVRAIVVSRAAPPPAFASFHAGNRMEIVGWDELRLTAGESRSIVRREAGRRLKKEVAQRLCDRADGWAAGLVLMSKGAATHSHAPQDRGQMTSSEVFEYFAGELFDKADARVRAFLLKTSYCLRFTPAMAAAITGDDRAAQILEELHRRNYFTERRAEPVVTYQYHALFRDFLRNQAERAYAPAIRKRLLRAAAGLHEESGQTEAAAELFVEARDWEGLGRVVLNHAPALLAQGRHDTVETWIAAIPQEIAARSAWLLYWKGINRLPFSPGESLTYLEKAFSLFSAKGDVPGIYLAWSGVMDSIHLQYERFNRFDPWIAAFRRIARRYGPVPDPAIDTRVSLSMFSALSLHSPNHPDAVFWRDRALALAHQLGDRDLQVRAEFLDAWRELFVGSTCAASARFVELYRRMRGQAITSSTRILVTTLLSIHYWLNGENGRCQATVSEALRAADESGVHLWDTFALGNGVAGALSAGDTARAEELLRRMEAAQQPSNEFDRSYYYYLAAWHAAQQEEWATARERAVKGVKAAEKLNYPFPESVNAFAAALAFSKARNDEAAKRYFSAGMRIAKDIESPSLRFIGDLADAEISLDRGNEPGVKAALRRAFSLGREQNYANAYWWRPAVMSRLCAKALEYGIETRYVRDVIRKRRLVPVLFPGETPAPLSRKWEESWTALWPWPIKVFTLGRFGVERDGKPVVFGPKAPRKPLDLLKAIIALGGDVSETRLVDALWPDAPGDAGHSAFTTTVQRLRLLLGGDDFVVVREGRVGLDTQRVWVDAWALERAATGAESGGAREEAERPSRMAKKDHFDSLRRLEEAAALYRGPFLADDEDKPWTTACQERLRARYLDVVAALGALHERARKYAEAVQVYRKGLDVDELTEELYQRLMRCFLKLGRRADAVRTYNRCRAVLAASLGVEPSDETGEIYKTAVAGGKGRHSP